MKTAEFLTALVSFQLAKTFGKALMFIPITYWSKFLSFSLKNKTFFCTGILLV